MSNEEKKIEKKDEFKELLAKAEPAIKAMLPKHMRPERFLRIAFATTRNPALRECTPLSLISCIVMASQVGLELGPGGVWLVPFFNKKIQKKECQIIVDYRGLCELAMRSEKVTAIEARAVKEGDVFKYSYGLQPTLIHEPAEDKARGKIVGAYAIARLKEGPEQFTYLSIGQIEDYRKRSKAAHEGPWMTDYEAMCLKTVVRRLTNLLPKSTELATALEAERRAEEDEQIGDLIDVAGFEVPEEPPYSEPKAKSETAQIQEQSKKSNGKVYELTEDHNKLWDAILELTGGELNEAANVLETLTKWTDEGGKVHEGKRELNLISQKMAQISLGKIKKQKEDKDKPTIDKRL